MNRTSPAAHFVAMAFMGLAMAMQLFLCQRALTRIVGFDPAPGRALMIGLFLGMGLGALLARTLARRGAGAKTLALLHGLLALVATGTGMALHLGTPALTGMAGAWLASGGTLAGAALACLCGAPMGLLAGMILTATFSTPNQDKDGVARTCALMGALFAGSALGLRMLGILALPVVGVTPLLLLAGATQILAALSALLGRPVPAATPRTRPFAPGKDAPRWALALSALAAPATGSILAVAGFHLADCFLSNHVQRPMAFMSMILLLLTAACALVLLAPNKRLSPRLPGSRTLLAGLLVLVGLGAVLAVRGLVLLVNGPGAGGFPGADTLHGSLALAGLLAPVFVPLGLLACLLTAEHAAHEKTLGMGSLLGLGGLGAALGLAWSTYSGLAGIGAMAVVSVGAILCLALAVGVLADNFQAGSKALPVLLLILAAGSLFLLRPPLHPALAAMPGQLLYREQDQNGLFAASLKQEQTLLATNDLAVVQYPLDSMALARSLQMLGHLGPLSHPEAESALVLGSGNLMAAGVLARYPRLARVTVVESLPATLHALEVLGPAAYLVNEEERIVWRADSGRRFLATHAETYDIIAVSAPEPRDPRVAQLYGQEGLALAHAHLNPGGVLVLRAQSAGLATILAGLKAQFAALTLYPDVGGGYVVLASDQAPVPDPLRVRWAASDPRVAEVLAQVGIEAEELPVLMAESALTPGDLPELFPENEALASDEHPGLEFPPFSSGMSGAPGAP